MGTSGGRLGTLPTPGLDEGDFKVLGSITPCYEGAILLIEGILIVQRMGLEGGFRRANSFWERGVAHYFLAGGPLCPRTQNDDFIRAQPVGGKVGLFEPRSENRGPAPPLPRITFGLRSGKSISNRRLVGPAADKAGSAFFCFLLITIFLFKKGRQKKEFTAAYNGRNFVGFASWRQKASAAWNWWPRKETPIYALSPLTIDRMRRVSGGTWIESFIGLLIAERGETSLEEADGGPVQNKADGGVLNGNQRNKSDVYSPE